PALGSIDRLSAPDSVALPLPGLLGIFSTILTTLGICSMFGLFVLALRGFASRIWLPPTIGTFAIFFASLDSSATLKETPSMIASSAVIAVLAFVIIRYVLGTNLLAYPLTIAVALLLGNGAELLQNHRADLSVNGIIER